MNINKIKIVCASVTTLLIAVSCSHTIESNEESAHTMKFISAGVETRAETTPDANYELFEDGSTIGVLAYNLPDGNYDETTNTPDLLFNAKLTKYGLGSYSYDPIVNWPSVGKVKFFAYHPHCSTFPTDAIVLSPFNNSGDPYITLDLQKASGKIDFSVASLQPLTPYKVNDPIGTPAREDYFVNFRFQRKLSELFFRAKVTDMPTDNTINIYINSVSIKNSNHKGTYHFKGDEWKTLSGADATTGATMVFGSTGIPLKNEYIDVINPGNEDGKSREASIVTIPCQYDVIKLSVIYTIEYLKASGGCEYRIVGTKEVPLTVNWKAATTYTYYLEFSYYEAYGNLANFNFTVEKWVENNITTEIN